jgi:GDPmannose 4,6-dehydratase
MENVAFITGVTGQDGSYLSELLLSKGYTVYGLVRRSSSNNTQRLKLSLLHPKFNSVYGDMNDASSLAKCIQKIAHQHTSLERLEVYNLAAQSHVQVSFDIPEYTSDVNGMGAVRLLEVLRMCNIPLEKIRFYQASTSEMFGDNETIPQNEFSKLMPISPYAISKHFAHTMVLMYRKAYQMYACSGILFNHESSRRGDLFLTKKIVLSVKALLRGEIDCIEVGNVDSVRDWGHAQDYVEGMWRILQQSQPEDYVLGTGQFISVREFITKVFEKHAIEIEWKGKGLDEIAIDKATGKTVIRISSIYFRPNEVTTLCADYTKAFEKLHWKPTYTLDTMVDEMIQNS